MSRRALGAVLAGAAVAAALPLALDDSTCRWRLCLVAIALATSWAMFCGVTGYISLGTSAFFGLGAYVCAWSLTALPWPLVILGGAAVAGSSPDSPAWPSCTCAGPTSPSSPSA